MLHNTAPAITTVQNHGIGGHLGVGPLHIGHRICDLFWLMCSRELRGMNCFWKIIHGGEKPETGPYIIRQHKIDKHVTQNVNGMCWCYYMSSTNLKGK